VIAADLGIAAAMSVIVGYQNAVQTAVVMYHEGRSYRKTIEYLELFV